VFLALLAESFVFSAGGRNDGIFLCYFALESFVQLYSKVVGFL
jgi:hypothetical protein